MKEVFQVCERTIPSHEVEKKGKEKSSNMNDCDLGVSKGKNKPYCKEQCPCSVKQDDRIKQGLIISEIKNREFCQLSLAHEGLEHLQTLVDLPPCHSSPTSPRAQVGKWFAEGQCVS
jgi:hypothetical protein